MNSSLKALTLSLAVLGSNLVNPLSAATAQAPTALLTVNATQDSVEISPGLADFVVAARLGSASQKPSKNVWIYRDLTTDDILTSSKRGYPNVVVTFKDHRVESLYLVTANATRKIIAQAKANPDVIPLELTMSNRPNTRRLDIAVLTNDKVRD